MVATALANPDRVVHPASAPGPAVFHDARGSARTAGHDTTTKLNIARGLARLIGVELAPDSDARTVMAPTLVVPSDTITSLAEARRLGIGDASQLFGGVVPHACIATKVISHPLPHVGAAAPPGWCAAFGERVREVVLEGWTAFSLADAQRAGEALLAGGAVRVKSPTGVGGAGQHVVRDAASLRACLDGIGAEAIAEEGIVLERNLAQVITHSVGQVQVGSHVASYVGTQRLVCNHHGHEVYGGSDLRVVRGGFDELAAQPFAAAQRRAIAQALAFHRAALDCFDGMLATRSNYDVAEGVDEAGTPRMGVLEQSWRIGGASGAELLALQAFADDPGLDCVSASTHEIYGEAPALPAGAFVSFDGMDDAGTGRLLKYAVVARDDQLA
jgi:hypothetical protein